MERRSQSCVNFKLTTSRSMVEKPMLSRAFAQPQTMSSDNLPLSLLEHPNSSSGAVAQQAPFPLQKPLRRKKLLRQKSTIDQDDYAADVEEEANESDLATRIQKQQGATSTLVKRHSNSSSNSTNTLPNDTFAMASTTPTRLCRFKHMESFDSNCSTNSTTAPSASADMSPLAQRHHFNMLMRDSSVQSDSSHYSSVDSLLESRKPDPEAILINLGFGPTGEDILSRIPKRFLKPSQVRGIDTDAFVKRLQLASSLAESSVMGFRGLTGNPDVPPSSIVAKIMERFEVNQRKKSMDLTTLR